MRSTGISRPRPGAARLRRGAALIATCMLAWPAAARPQTAAASETPPALEAVAPTAAATVAPAAAFDVEAATDAYLARLSPEKKARSDAYFEGGYWLILWGFIYTAGVTFLLLYSGLSARLRDLAARLTRRAGLQAWIYSLLYIVVTAALGFPLTVYQEFFREHRYGLATQTFPDWLGDQGKALAVSLVMGGLLLAGLYAVLRRAPRTWWIWGAVFSIAFLIVGVTIAPVYIEPLFNEYTTLDDPALRDPILSMAHANGIPADQVFVVDASRQTNRVSANVAGLFGTMRIALNDNLLRRASPASIEAVMGHEMGHYVLNHIYEMIPVFGLILAGGFAFARWGFYRLTAGGRGERWRVGGVADPAGLPILSLLLATYFFVLTPALNTIIRVNEAEADIFGLNASREPDGFAEVALMLGEYRKLEPGPLEEWFFFDHPSGRTRIRMAMQWKAEHLADAAATTAAGSAGVGSKALESAAAP